MRTAICIPIYKEVPDVYEKISIQRLVDITKYKYDIYFVRPQRNISMKEYYDLMPGWEGHVFEIPFSASYFMNTTTYSELCKSYEFYNAFAEYDYLLIYQTDCYIVRDEIDDWASKGYDYGEWTSQVITELGFDSISCCSGSFGAGVLAKTMCVSPEKIKRALLYVPSGIKNAPAINSMSMMLPMIMYWITHKDKWLKKTMLPIAITEDNITDDLYQTAKLSIMSA